MIMTHVWLLCLLFILLISEKDKKEDKKEKEEKPPIVSLLQLVKSDFVVLKRTLSSHHPTSSCTVHWPRHLSVTDTAVKNPKDCFNFSHPDVKLQPHKFSCFPTFMTNRFSTHLQIGSLIVFPFAKQHVSSMSKGKEVVTLSGAGRDSNVKWSRKALERMYGLEDRGLNRRALDE